MSEDYRKEVRSITTEAQWTFWFIAWRLIIAVILLAALGFIVSLLFRPAQVVDRVLDPDRIIQNYEWFEETYNDVKAFNAQIVTAKQQVADFQEAAGPRADWRREDTVEFNRLNAVLMGLRNQRDSTIAQYNARSNQITRNLFKGSNLPYQLQVIEDQAVEDWVR